MKKYNLALVPQSQVFADKIIQLANQCQIWANSYLLGARSRPHVTLYQFHYEETDIEKLWEQICKTWKAPAVTLAFDTISFTTFNKPTYWISLLPNHAEDLHEMHVQIASLLQLPVKKQFDPHMTLFNTRNIYCEAEVRQIINRELPVSDTFKLALVDCDAVGQLTELIYLLPTL